MFCSVGSLSQQFFYGYPAWPTYDVDKLEDSIISDDNRFDCPDYVHDEPMSVDDTASHQAYSIIIINNFYYLSVNLLQNEQTYSKAS